MMKKLKALVTPKQEKKDFSSLFNRSSAKERTNYGRSDNKANQDHELTGKSLTIKTGLCRFLCDYFEKVNSWFIIILFSLLNCLSRKLFFVF